MIKKYPLKLNTRPGDGLVLRIHHTIRESTDESRRIKITSAAFNNLCEKIACSDHRGNIFVSDLLECKYWVLPLKPSRVLSFVPLRCDILLVALNSSPYDLLLVDIRTAQVLTKLCGHVSRAEYISFSSSLQYILTSTNKEAIIWEANKYTKYFVLNTKEDIKQIEFAPVSDNIIARYISSIQMWKRDTYEPLKICSDTQFKNVTGFTFTVNGRALIISYSSHIAIVNTDTWGIKTIKLNENIASNIKSIKFLPETFDGGSNKILLILTTASIIYFYNMEKKTVTFTLPCSDIKNFITSINGKYIACILQLGEVHIYKSSLLKNKYDLKKEKTGVADTENKDRSFSNATDSIANNDDVFVDKILSSLNNDRFKRILLHFNEYPSKYRNIIWKIILNTPNNTEAYNGLNNRNTHTVFAHMEHSIEIKYGFYIIHLKKLLSCLAHWCPLFAQSKHLRTFVFPFLKIFYKDPLFCFEALATILVNYCQHWFMYSPLPPVNVLAIIENVLGNTDQILIQHFIKNNVTGEIYAWKILKTAFSEVLLSSEWMILWDHILSNEPAFILLAVVAYNIIHRNTLLNIKTSADFKEFYISQNPINMKIFIKKCYVLLNELSDEIHPRRYLKSLIALDKGDSYTQYHINSLKFK